METLGSIFCIIFLFQFLSYLWGMETLLCFIVVFCIIPFLSYLWGMETQLCQYNCIVSKFRSYPTYEEWKQCKLCLLIDLVPRSYPTYEEWKLVNSLTNSGSICSFLSYLWGMETQMEVMVYISKTEFLSYLWGMETSYTMTQSAVPKPCSYPTYEEWKPYTECQIL